MKFVDFTPDGSSKNKGSEIPFLEDMRTLAGWEGQTTGKDERTLVAEIHNEVSFMGGHIINFEKGTFKDEYGERTGYVFKILVISSDDKMIPAKIECVSLPVRNKTPKNRDQALRTALWNLRSALAASRRMEALVPGYRAIVGFLQTDPDGPTLSQSWLMQKALPMKDDDEDIIEAETND